MITATSYALVPTAGSYGYPNQGPWNSTLTDVAATAQELVGILRDEGVNTFMYVQFGTAAIASAGLPLKPTTGLTDTNAFISPVTLTALGATAAGYLSAIGVSIGAVASGLRYGWVCVKGIGTLPLNSNTAGLAFGTHIAPSSASAGFADCAGASAAGRAFEGAGLTLGTATQEAKGGLICQFNFLKSYA